MNEHKLTGASLETELTVRGLRAIEKALERPTITQSAESLPRVPGGILERPRVPLERAWKGWRSEQ